MPAEPIDLFVEDLLKEANLSSLPEDFKDQYVEKVKEQLNRHLGLTIMENLDEEGLKEFSKLMTTGKTPDFNRMQVMFSHRIPDFEQKMQKAMVDFAKNFVSAVKK